MTSGVTIGALAGELADYVEEMGFTHILVFDHVLGANPERPGGWKGPYTYRHAFHEPFVLFGFLATIALLIQATLFASIVARAFQHLALQPREITAFCAVVIARGTDGEIRGQLQRVPEPASVLLVVVGLLGLGASAALTTRRIQHRELPG